MGEIVPIRDSGQRQKTVTEWKSPSTTWQLGYDDPGGMGYSGETISVVYDDGVDYATLNLENFRPGSRQDHQTMSVRLPLDTLLQIAEQIKEDVNNYRLSQAMRQAYKEPNPRLIKWSGLKKM